MTSPPVDVKLLFAQLAEGFAGRDRVTLPADGPQRGFGAGALRVDGTIFAMLSRGLLTVKLPPPRVRELVADDTGVPFRKTEAHTPWREWVAVREADPELWEALAEEALAYVRG